MGFIVVPVSPNGCTVLGRGFFVCSGMSRPYGCAVLGLGLLLCSVFRPGDLLAIDSLRLLMAVPPWPARADARAIAPLLHTTTSRFARVGQQLCVGLRVVRW